MTPVVICDLPFVILCVRLYFADDEDLFQCGKCKSEFTNLATFLSHKQSQCSRVVAASKVVPSGSSSEEDAGAVSNPGLIYTQLTQPSLKQVSLPPINLSRCSVQCYL